MIVNSYSSTSASVVFGRGGHVGIQSIFLSRLVNTLNTETLHVFQRIPSQLYEVILVLFGMLAN